MAEQKELRRMNRTELIEIIYALQQQEQDLRRENKELSDELEDRKIRLENAGSISEAALSLNHIFEDAQAAADQYLMSVKDGGTRTEEADQILSEAQLALVTAQQSIDTAKEKAEQIVAAAQTRAEKILASAQSQTEKILASAQSQAEQILTSAKSQADVVHRQGKQAAEMEMDKFLRKVECLLSENPELAAALRENSKREDDG